MPPNRYEDLHAQETIPGISVPIIFSFSYTTLPTHDIGIAIAVVPSADGSL